MAVVCAACGAENRDKARYCRGCAQPLVPLAPGAVPTAAAPERRSRSRSRRKAADRAAAPWWKHPAAGWSVAAALAVGGLGAWWSLPGAQVPAAAAPTAPVSVPAPALTALPTSSASAVVPSAAIESTVTAGQPVPAPAVALAPQTGETVRATAAPVVTRAPRAPKPRAEPSPPTAPAETPAVSRQAPSPAAPAETAPPAAPAARTPTVDERCADRSNFLSRDLCRIQACGNPALAADPVCVRFREMEAANRERLGN